jgi:hypothetical protein
VLRLKNFRILAGKRFVNIRGGGRERGEREEREKRGRG